MRMIRVVQQQMDLIFGVAAEDAQHIAAVACVHADEIVVVRVILAAELHGVFPLAGDAAGLKQGADGRIDGIADLALNVAKKNPQKTVAFFSLEMSKEQLVTRLISNESFVDNKKLVTGQLSMEEWSKIGIAATALSQTDIRVDDNPSLSVAEMNAKCRRLDNLCLVIIDYLQLMVSAGGRSYSGENRQQVVSDISRSLKIMAKELNVPVLCLSQLSRANESRQDKRPLLSDLRESGAIEQDADEVMFLYREDYYNKDTPEQNVAECIVAKNRHGETGTVKLQWLPQFTTFADREWRHDEG